MSARKPGTEDLPMVETAWRYWRQLYPETRVISGLGIEYTPGTYTSYPYGPAQRRQSDYHEDHNDITFENIPALQDRSRSSSAQRIWSSASGSARSRWRIRSKIWVNGLSSTIRSRATLWSSSSKPKKTSPSPTQVSSRCNPSPSIWSSRKILPCPSGSRTGRRRLCGICWGMR